MGCTPTEENSLLNQLPLLVSGLGILVAVLPVVLLPSSSGAVAFVVLVTKGIGVTAGLGVVGVGLYSSRTGDHRPAAATGLVVIASVVVGVIGGLVEVTSGLLVPIWVWFSSAMLAVGVAVVLTYRFIDGPYR